MHQPVGFVARMGELLEFAILVRMCLGVLDHLLDFLVRKSAGRLDLDRLLLAGGLVLG
ncbi:NAD-specific glutamate dehydrogenase [compost metagenome]